MRPERYNVTDGHCSSFCPVRVRVRLAVRVRVGVRVGMGVRVRV